MNNTFEVKGIKYTFLPEENNIIVDQGDKIWRLSNDFQGVVARTSDGKTKGMYFKRAKEITREVYEDGMSYGLKCNFKGFELEDKIVDCGLRSADGLSDKYHLVSRELTDIVARFFKTLVCGYGFGTVCKTDKDFDLVGIVLVSSVTDTCGECSKLAVYSYS